MDLCLSQIKNHLEECGVETEYRSERVKPYLNIGDVKHVKNRVQFWRADHGDGIDMVAGIEMGKWYTESEKSVYLDTLYSAKPKIKGKENLVAFPNINVAMDFISSVTKA